MKLTKIDGIYHYKEDKGKLKKYNCNKETKTLLKKRFSATIESKVEKEWFRVVEIKEDNKGDKPRTSSFSNSKIKTLYNFIYELYLISLDEGDKRKKEIEWPIKFLLEINLKDSEIVEKIKEKKYKLIKGYKLLEDKYLYKDDEEIQGKTFIELFTNLQNEIKEKGIQEKKNVQELTSYLELKNIFKKYVDRKLEVLERSIANNKINIKIENNQIKENDSLRERFYLEVLEKCKKDLNKDTITTEVNKFYITNNMSDILEKIENILFENKKKKDIKKNIRELFKGRYKETILDKEYNYETYGKTLLFKELKEYIRIVLHSDKEKVKKQEKDEDKSEDLYIRYLKKVLTKDKLEKEIKGKLKNKIINHIIDYGKIAHYKNDILLKDKEVLGTRDLEYIKAKESLTRKISAVTSFAIHSYNRLIKEDTPLEVINEMVGEEFKLFDAQYIDENKLKYFFNKELIEKEAETNLFIRTIHNSLNLLRNNTAHFKEVSLEFNETKLSNLKLNFGENKSILAIEEVRDSLKNIEKKLNEKFQSNNLEYYYTDENLNSYFEIYEFKLLKAKIPFVPNFKRILKKGEKLYEGIKDKNKYGYFFIEEKGKVTSDEIKSYLNAKNYLLKELYYNNFMNFLKEDKILFNEGIKIAKKRKEDTGNRKNTGVAYRDFNELKNNETIEEYVANLHKEEMNRLGEDKFKINKTKVSSLYINEFLEDVFLEAFIYWLKEKEKLSFIKNNEILEKVRNKDYLDKKTRKKNYNIKIEKIDLDLDDDKILILYLAFTLSENKRISQLSNEIIKYEQYLKNKGKSVETKFLEIELDTYRKVIELVLLTKKQITSKEIEDNKTEKSYILNKYYESEEEYKENLKCYVDEEIFKESEKITDEKDILYHQTNKKTLILHGNIEKTRQYGFNNLIRNIYKKYSKEERGEYLKLSSRIINLQEEKAKQHKILVRKKNILKKEKLEFIKICENIRRYDYLKKKQTLYIAYELHEIASDIQGRYLAYLNKYERDYKFFQKAMGYDESGKIKKDKKYISFELIKPLFNREGYQARDYIAHFHHYLDLKKHGTSNFKYLSFIDQMNLLIDLFDYDKKMKNHITKSLKTILEKYNLIITFELENKSLDRYRIKELKSVRGKILGQKNSFILQEKEFCEIIKKMLEYKK